MKHSWIKFSLAFLLIVGLLGIRLYPFSSKKPLKIESKTRTIPARRKGILVKKHFHKGDYVPKGALLFTLEDPSLQASLEETEAKVKLLEAKKKWVETQLNRKTSAYFKAKKDVALKNLSQEEVENKLLDLQEIQMKKNFLEAQIDYVNQKHKQLLKEKENLSTYSPYEGIISEEWATENSSIDTQPVFSLSDLNDLFITLDVSNKQAEKLVKRKNLSLKVLSYPEASFEGEIISQTSLEKGKKQLQIQIIPSSGQEKPLLRPGMLVHFFSQEKKP